MRLDNETGYSTEDLRRFFAAGLRALMASSNKEITVKLARRRHVHGRASYGRKGFPGETPYIEGRRIVMFLPKPEYLDTHGLAGVFRHEVEHNQGVRHRAMSKAVRYCTTDETWARTLVIGWSPEPARPTREAITMGKAVHAREMLARAERRAKLAKTIVTRWKRRVTYYDRKLAAGQEPR